MNFEIIGTGRAVPPRKVTNDALARELDTSDEWIRSHTGIGSRYIAGEEIANSDLSAAAAKQALSMAEPALTPEDAAMTIDLVIVATVTGDHLGCPSAACIVQDKLGAKKAAAMDLAAGCTGFIYALETAAGLLMMNNQRKRALVIGCEVLSKFIDWKDRATCVLFGDGAGAVILEKTEDSTVGNGTNDTGNTGDISGSGVKNGLLQSVLYADGSGGDHLIIRKGGSRNPFKAGETLEKGIHIEMNGQAVYNFAVKAVTETIAGLIAAEGISVNDIKKIIPHQANARIIQAAAKRLKIPEDKFYMNIEEYANTSAASIPIALDELNRKGELQYGDLIMTVGFGAGLTYGGNIIRWSIKK
ncbi:MAG: ketoacyl-ACP synthase III [Treponema sp.]|nr:ketoacyl-ACP synthase III [Treponema sp.]